MLEFGPGLAIIGLLANHVRVYPMLIGLPAGLVMGVANANSAIIGRLLPVKRL